MVVAKPFLLGIDLVDRLEALRVDPLLLVLQVLLPVSFHLTADVGRRDVDAGLVHPILGQALKVTVAVVELG